MEMDAIIQTIGETMVRGAKGFQVRELIAVTEFESKYPQTVKFEVLGDKVTLLDDYQEGQKVRLHFDIRGREWAEKVFNSLVIWRIESDEQNTPQTQRQPQPRAIAQPTPQVAVQGNLDGSADELGDEEIPF